MLWEVDVRFRDSSSDHSARAVVAAARDLGIVDCTRAQTGVGWLVEGEISERDASRIAEQLLRDPVTEECRVGPVGAAKLCGGPADLPVLLHVMPRAGVTDPAAESAREAMHLLGVAPTAVRSIRKYWLPPLAKETIDRLAWKLLASDAVHDVVVGPLAITRLSGGRPWAFAREAIPLEGLDDSQLAAMSRDRCLALAVAELSAIRDHYRRLGRDPLEIELETIAQTWSEHCCHKTLSATVEHDGPRGRVRFVHLLKETVFAATQEIRRRLGDRDWCVSVFRDNSGVVRFDDDHDICVKVETHNHPSAIEPYGGAATGLGGVIRDVLGTGLAAKPVANLDVFCVGEVDAAADELPPGVIHPRRLLDGVVAGVRDYGNRMGIPTIAGAVAFDPGYVGNPLVFCGCVGIMPRGSQTAKVSAGDLVVVAGGRTGRDGIHGATFSSIELSSESESESGGAVQIGHAIHEKVLLEFVLAAAREGLFSAITDCGAGGLSSAVGEMAAELGAEVDLATVPLKYDGLSATEVWISEAQERMVLAVPPAAWERLRAIAGDEGVEATAIGRFTGDGRLQLKWGGETAGELDCHFLHDGRPRLSRSSRWRPAAAQAEAPPATHRAIDLASTLSAVMALPDIASKEWIIRQYDHEVQGASAVKPILGPGEGPADGSIVRGVLGRPRGIVLGVGLRHRLGRVDPYQMAAGGIVEAMANVIAAGADPDRIALLDNFCWGECRSDEGMGGLVEACLACRDMALAFDAPFVSGKDSLNNVFTWTDSSGRQRELSIPPTLLATAMGQIDDVRRSVTSDFKRAGDGLYLVGLSRDCLAGSQIERLLGGELGFADARVPEVDADACRGVFRAVARAQAEGLVAACHDLSDGGLLAAAAEMAIGGSLGAVIDLTRVPVEMTGDKAGGLDRDAIAAFTETPGRFLCEVPQASWAAFERIMKDVPHARIGGVEAGDAVAITTSAGNTTRIPIAKLADAWRSLSRSFSA
jgi:phosphoribosylformylglycinamidine synthase